MEKKPENFRERLKGWRLGISIEIESVIRCLLCVVLISFFALLQTTLFTRFRPFGAVPDLMLPLVICIGVMTGEKWGAAAGVFAAFVIESLGGAEITILSLLYMPVGYICGRATVFFFRDCLLVRAMYTVAATLLRSVFTLFILASSTNVGIPDIFSHAMVPEFLATLLFAVLPHGIGALVFRFADKK